MTDPTEVEQAAVDALLPVHQVECRHPADPVCPVCRRQLLALLRAVPLDYCIQRVIGEQALIKAQVDRCGWAFAGPNRALYRLATENET